MTEQQFRAWVECIRAQSDAAMQLYREVMCSC